MDVDTILEKARSAMGPDTVFGAAHEREGVIVIPASRVFGGGGGGADEADPGGGGGGFGLHARPAGALVIEPDGSVHWRVPLDINRVILGGQLVAVAFFFFVWLTQRSRARAAAKAAMAVGTPDRND